MRARLAPIALTLFLLAVASAELRAQVGSGTDILTGSVTGSLGEPLSGVSVAFTSVETGVRRATLSNQQGRFTMVFPGGGGRYEVEATFLGMAPVRRTITRLGDEEVLIVNLQMDVAPIMVEGVAVTARRAAPGEQREPGSQERALSGEALNRLPVDATDLNALATLMPGVVGLEGGDSLGLALSIMGQGPMANQVTLDGASFGGGDFDGGLGVPQEAVRMTRVITNTYDVARGQFSGGQIATTTRSGTNNVQGSFSWLLRDPALQWTQEDGPFGGEFRQNRLSGGVGGPLIRDRLFYFGSFSLQRRSEGLQSLTSADPAALQRLGASPDTVARFLSLLGERGIYSPGIPAPSERIGDGLNLLGRLDYNLNERHTLTVRGDARLSQQDPFRVGPLGLPQTGGVVESSGGGGMLTLTSRFGNGWINELRAYASTNERETQPYVELPEGRVRVSSLLEDGSRSVSTLVFGSGTAGGSSRSQSVELSNELSLLIGTAHRVRVGGIFNRSSTTQEAVSNRFGTYTFNSLEDFEEGRAASFTRALTTRQRESGGINAALYAGDTWRPHQRLQVTYGARMEASSAASQPEYNPRVEELFGVRTDAIPSEVRISPRVGFSYNLTPAGDGGPRGVIRGGFGEFRARPNFSLFGAAHEATGLPDAQVQLYCVGEAVPFPDWDAFRESASSIPSACVGESSELPVSGRGNSVTVFDPDFGAARSWRASLGMQRRVQRFISLSVDANYALGVGQQGTRDLNLDTRPAFLLAEEGNRPVFVAPDAIVPATGQTGFLASRLHPEFGEVQEMHSELRSRTAQLSTSVSGFLPPLRAMLQGSYTYTRSTDQGSSSGGWGGRWGGGFGGGGSLSSTVGDPNQPEWATSDFERRHAFTGMIGRQLRPWLDLTVIGRATSGRPFSPLVGGDINGDGARNDRAFVFDPATTADPALAEGMQRVLENVPGRVRECLVSQLGELAERNSCRAPWGYSLDLRANARPELPGLGRRLTLSLDAVNTLTGVDRLIHGLAGMRGWGQQGRPDDVLLYPRGFDPAAQSFRYEVNERFGISRQGASAFRNPFQLQVQARMAVGRVQQGGGRGMGGGMMMGPGGRRGGPGGGEGTGAGGGTTGMIERLLVNPIEGILALEDSLRLTPEQTERLQAVSDSLGAYQAELGDSLREMQRTAGAGGNPAALFQTLAPRLQEARTRTREALDAAEEILTPEQWARVPEELRTVRQPQRGGQQRGGGGNRSTH